MPNTKARPYRGLRAKVHLGKRKLKVKIKHCLQCGIILREQNKKGFCKECYKPPKHSQNNTITKK